MITTPKKNTLERQTAEILRAQIDQGAWTEWLPGIRTLVKLLQVSSHTVCAALRQLRRDGVIVPEKGVGNKIVRKRNRKNGAKPGGDVGMLVCGDFHQIPPASILWVDHVRASLAERGKRLRLFDGRAYTRQNPARALKKLARQHPHQCWMLLCSSEDAQAWFQKNAVPCVVAGSVYVGIDLPCCDVDYRAVCRHAAGLLLRRGHRRVALLIKRSRRAGDILSEAGFEEAFARPGIAVAPPLIWHCNATVGGVAEAVRQLMAQKPRPTALLVADPFHCLTVIDCLHKLGLDVPRDVSVISRDHETCHDHLLSRPASYTANPRHFARPLLDMITTMLDGGMPPARAHYVMPEFSEGRTVAPPPPENKTPRQ